MLPEVLTPAGKAGILGGDDITVSELHVGDLLQRVTMGTMVEALITSSLMISLLQ